MCASFRYRYKIQLVKYNYDNYCSTCVCVYSIYQYINISDLHLDIRFQIGFNCNFNLFALYLDDIYYQCVYDTRPYKMNLRLLTM